MLLQNLSMNCLLIVYFNKIIRLYMTESCHVHTTASIRYLTVSTYVNKLFLKCVKTQLNSMWPSTSAGKHCVSVFKEYGKLEDY